MIGSSKNNKVNYPRKCFWTQEKETRVKFNPALSANQPSNNRALVKINQNYPDIRNFKPSNDATAPRTSLKRWICVLSVFIAIIPTYLLCQMYAHLPKFEFQGTILNFRKRNKISSLLNNNNNNSLLTLLADSITE